MVRKWFLSIVVILVLSVAILTGVRSVQHARATGNTSVQLSSIRVSGDDYLSHGSYHRGENILLWAFYSGSSVEGWWVIVHPAVYHSSYRLLNVSTAFSLQSYEGIWSVTIPKNAPTGIYKYYFTLGQSGYLDQTLMITFNVIR